MDFEDDESAPEVAPPIRFDWFGLVATAVELAQHVAGGVHLAVIALNDQVQCHASWRLERREFTGQVMGDLSALP